MASTSDQQVPRLFMFIHKVCLPVVRTYFDDVILSDHKYNNNFKTFLEYNKHEIYHLYASQPCCKCQDGKVLSYKNHRLFQKQFDKVYTLGSPDRSHISYRNGIVCKQCSCGLVSKESCTTKELDMSALYAILKTCVSNLHSSHAMWLDKIVEERNKLCHMPGMMSENQAEVMWSYLEGSILGLASDIPPIPRYREGIEIQVELLKDGNFSFDTVRPVIEAIRLEIAEQNNNINRTLQKQMSDMKHELHDSIKLEAENTTLASKIELKETIHQSTAVLHDTISEQAAKVSSGVKESVEEMSNQIVETVDKTKSEIISAVEELKGSFTHKNESLVYDVEWSSEEATFDEKKGKIYVNFNITSAGLSEEQIKDIKDSMRKAAESIGLWKPYRIVLVYKGSIVIGTLLPVDVFKNKTTFEDSIRGFLDQFTQISGLNTKSKIKLKIDVVVCQSAASSSVHSHEIERSFTKNKSVQAVPLMSDKVVDTSQDIIRTGRRERFYGDYDAGLSHKAGRTFSYGVPSDPKTEGLKMTSRMRTSAGRRRQNLMDDYDKIDDSDSRTSDIMMEKHHKKKQYMRIGEMTASESFTPDNLEDIDDYNKFF